MSAAPAQPHATHTLELGSGLVGVRALVRDSAAAAGLAPARVAEVVLAAHEVALNAVTHGRGGGAVRVWTADHELVCEIEDNGPGMADPRAGLSPPDPDDLHGRGLWIARQLCELVEVQTSAAGTRVRLRVQLAPAG